MAALLAPIVHLTSSMADTAKPAAAEGDKSKARPEKPDEEAYKSKLAVAEKEHKAAQEKLVRSQICLIPRSYCF